MSNVDPSAWSSEVPQDNGSYWFYGWPHGQPSRRSEPETLIIRVRWHDGRLVMTGQDIYYRSALHGLWGPRVVTPSTPGEDALAFGNYRRFDVVLHPWGARTPGHVIARQDDDLESIRRLAAERFSVGQWDVQVVTDTAEDTP